MVANTGKMKICLDVIFFLSMSVTRDQVSFKLEVGTLSGC